MALLANALARSFSVVRTPPTSAPIPSTPAQPVSPRPASYHSPAKSVQPVSPRNTSHVSPNKVFLRVKENMAASVRAVKWIPSLIGKAYYSTQVRVVVLTGGLVALYVVTPPTVRTEAWNTVKITTINMKDFLMPGVYVTGSMLKFTAYLITNVAFPIIKPILSIVIVTGTTIGLSIYGIYFAVQKIYNGAISIKDGVLSIPIGFKNALFGLPSKLIGSAPELPSISSLFSKKESPTETSEPPESEEAFFERFKASAASYVRTWIPRSIPIPGLELIFQLEPVEPERRYLARYPQNNQQEYQAYLNEKRSKTQAQMPGS